MFFILLANLAELIVTDAGHNLTTFVENEVWWQWQWQHITQSEYELLMCAYESKRYLV